MNKKFAFIGAGNMGAALALAVCKGIGAENVTLFDPDMKKAQALSETTGCAIANSAENAAAAASFIVICVKPNLISTVLKGLVPILKDGVPRNIVSIAAGVSIASIAASLDGLNLPIIRLMPNTPVSVGKGTIIMAQSGAKAEDTELLKKTLASGGEVFEIDEKLIDATTPVFSCSPAFTYMYIEALADGAVKSGVPRELAQKLAAQSVIGAATMVLETGKHPAKLKDEVCSPGGSTIVGVAELEKGALRATVGNAVYEAYKKTAQLGK